MTPQNYGKVASDAQLEAHDTPDWDRLEFVIML
jgi:hypothetical protein